MSNKRPLIAFYVRSCLVGFALATVFTAALTALDIVRIGYLVTRVPGGHFAVLLLWFLNGVVFSGAQAAISILRRVEREEKDPAGAPERAAASAAVRGD